MNLITEPEKSSSPDSKMAVEVLSCCHGNGLHIDKRGETHGRYPGVQ